MASPRIVKTKNEFNESPYFDVFFPDTNTVWRYQFDDQAVMGRVLARQSLNIGRVVALAKQFVASGAAVAIDVTGDYTR